MSGWIPRASTYQGPGAIESVMRPPAVGEVVDSRTPEFASGDALLGWFG